jgi:phosphohistidine phosphatase
VNVLIVRHAIAVERGTPGFADDDRPLTAEGETKFRSAAKGLARVLGAPDTMLTSPLPRAHRTAELAAEAWGGLALTVTPVLAGGSFAEIAAMLSSYRGHSCVALFGHEPDVSELLARLLGTPHSERLEFKKGAAALVQVPGRLEGGGRLVWFLPPKVLRELAG